MKMVKRKRKAKTEERRPLDPIRDIIGLAPLFVTLGVAIHIASIMNDIERQSEIERIAKAYVDLEIAIQKERRKRETFHSRLKRLFTPQ
jgi:hypothetical protein